MRRHESKARQKERGEIDKQATKSSSNTIETDEETITKLLAGKVYEKDDIIKVAQKLLPLYNHDFSTQFAIVDKIDNFMTSFDNISLETNKPIFGIFGKPKKRWVLFCVLHNDDKKTALFKDPSGAPVSFRLEKKIVEKFGEVEFIAQTQKDQKDEDEKSYGPLTVRNLKILLDFLKEGKDLNDFSEVKFSQALELNNEKFNKVAALTKELGKNAEFKEALKDFIDKLPLDLGSGMLEYKKIMEEELEKGEEEADLERIKKARQMYLTQENVEQIQSDYKLNAKEEEGEQVKEYQLEIQNKFPDEMKKLSDIFEVLDDIKVDDKLYKALENISEILEISFKKMKSFYEFKASLEVKEEIVKLTPGSINDIATKLPQMSQSVFSDCTPLDQLLKEVTLGMDQEDSSPNEQSLNEIQQIEAKYYKIKQSYETWKSTDIQAIHQWAQQIKGKLGTTDDVVCETIAIMDRALNLLTGGHRLRDTQILAVLIFFHGQNNKGRLCQIKTGEGKTVIVSLLAVIRALQGYTVDVITSNPLLASDGVDETKAFYTTFALTVATNNPGQSKACYTADVLYGTISNFQFDFLKDSFEGYNIRGERKFGQVVLDEVDSMLVDNGGHIAKLAAPYPGMECLRYIYIKIWQELHKAEESFVKECQDKIREFVKYPKDEARAKYSEFIGYMIKNERKIIKEKIRASDPTNVPLVPAHLKEYVTSKLDTWIKNALHAKYNCHEHQQYRIMTDDRGEKIITPVDYLNTGVTMKNTIWSNGLHQFVQLKHNLYLTFESLTSSFISNIGYIKNYNDKNIFGLTGTLGSTAEQELLSHIYHIDYAKIPTYKAKKFEELPGIVADDDSWAEQVTLEVLAKVDEKRAVLVICETEQDLMTVKKNLQLLKNEDKFNIRTYANEDNAGETGEKVKIGDVILATNIAGRGTNFRTQKDLEANGGLHVCVGFLPCNLRVEGQAFGRTSRQGNNGTAQLILRQSEVDELDFTTEKPSFSQIKLERDNLERSRLKQINDTLVKELNFKDELFKYFSDFHRNLKREKMTESYRYVLQDLKEFWAFWLEKKNFKAKTISGTTPQKEFENFLSEARSIIDGTISHNPYYCVGLGDHYLEKNDRAGATRVLTHAIDMGGPQNYELLTGAHMKLFELAIQGGEQVRERFKKAIAKIFFVDIEKNEEYRRVAKIHLEHAKASIRKEISYIDGYLKEGNEDFERILLHNESLFLKHIYSRLFCLKVHEGNIEELLDMVNNLRGGVDLNGKAPTTLDNFLKMSNDPHVKKNLTNCEMAELQSIGVDAIYSLKEIHDVPDAVIYTSVGQILGGIAALCIGLAFLPIFPVMSSIAGTLISEGIIDIVMQIITQGNTEFDSTDFLKGKFISYGVSLISFGISAITQSVKILSKAVSFCRKLSSFLKNSKHLKGLCNTLAKFIDKIGDKLEKMLTVAKFNKLSNADKIDELEKLRKVGNTQMFEKLGGAEKLKSLGKIQNLRKSEVLLRYAGEFAWKTGKQIGYTLIEELVVKPLLNEILQQVIDKIKDHFKNTLKNSITKDGNLILKIQSTPRTEIDEVVDSFMQENEVLKTAKEVGIELAGLCNNQIIDILTIVADITHKMAEFARYNLAFTSFLNRNLNGGNCTNNVDEIIDDICTRLADQMFTLCCDVMKGNFKFVKMGYQWGKKKVGEMMEDQDGLSSKRKKKIETEDDDDNDTAKKSTKRRNSQDDEETSTNYSKQKKNFDDSDDDSKISTKRTKKFDGDESGSEDNSSSKSKKKPSDGLDQNEEDEDADRSSKKSKKFVAEDSENEDDGSKTKKKSDQPENEQELDESTKSKKKSDKESNSEESRSSAKTKSEQIEEDDDSTSSQKRRKKGDDEESDTEDSASSTKKKLGQNEEDGDSLPKSKKKTDEGSDDETTSTKKKKENDEESDSETASPKKKKQDNDDSEDEAAFSKKKTHDKGDSEDETTSSKKKKAGEDSDEESTSSEKKKSDSKDEHSKEETNSDDEGSEESKKKKKKKEKLKQIGKILQDKLLEPLLNAALEECIQQIKESLKDSLKNSIRSNSSLMTKLQTTAVDNINDAVSNFINGDPTFNMAKKIGFKILGVMKNKAITALTTIFDIIKNSVDFGIYINTCASYLEKNLEGATSNNNVDGIIDQISSKVSDHLCKLLKDVGRGHVQIVKMSYEWDKKELKKIFSSKEIMKTLGDLDTWKEIGKILLEESAFQPIIDKVIEEIKNFFKNELKKSIGANHHLIEKLQSSPVEQISNTVDVFIRGDETFNIAKKMSLKLLELAQNKTLTAVKAAFNIVTNSIDFSNYFNKFAHFLNEHFQGGDCENNIEQITENICSKAADQMYFLLKETGKDSIQLGKIGYELKDENLGDLFNKNEILNAVSDKDNWKDFGQMLLQQEMFQPLIDKVIEEIKKLFKNDLKNSIRNNENLVNKLQSSVPTEINDVVDTFIRGNETLNMAKKISFKVLDLVKHKAITALATAFEITKNFIDFSNYFKNFTSYLDEHLHGGDYQNNFEEISDNICTKAADQMYALLKATGQDSVQLAKLTSELRKEDFKVIFNTKELEAALTNKEAWKTVAQNIIKEEVYQPLIDKVIEEVKNSFEETLKKSINNNDDLLKKIQTTPADQINNVFLSFMQGDETLNIAKNMTNKISGLVQHKAVTALTATFAIVKNSIDFAGYINTFSSYLGEHLSGGDCENNVGIITDEMCAKAADRMHSLLKDIGKDTVELAMIGYDVRNEDLTMFIDKEDITAALTDKEKWKQIGQAIVNQEVVQPLINKAEDEVKHSFEKVLEDKIRNNDTLVNKLQTTPIDRIFSGVYNFMSGDETFNMVKKISEKISGLTNHKAVTALTTTFNIVKNSVQFAGYCNKFSSYLEDHLSGGNCHNDVESIITKISSEAADQMYSLLKNTGKDTIKLARIGNDLKTEDLSKLLDKDKLVAAVTDKDKWKQIGQVIIKDEVLQPLVDKALDEIKECFKETLENSIKSNDNIMQKLQTSPRKNISDIVNAFINSDDTFKAANDVSDKISASVQHKSVTALATTFAIVKNSVDFAGYTTKYSSYLEEQLPGGSCDNNVDDLIEEMCSQSSDRMYSLLKDSSKDAIELAKIGYELKNEDLTKLFSGNDIVSSFTNKAKWEEIGRTIVKEEVLQPLLEKATEEVKQCFKKDLEKSIYSNDNLIEKLKFSSVDEVNKTVNEYMKGDESLTVVKKISDKISGLVQHKAVTALSTTITAARNLVDLASYIKTFSSYLEENLSGGDCGNAEQISEIVEQICSVAADHMFHLLKDTGSSTLKLVKIGYNLKNEDFTKLINKDQILNTLTDSQTWNQIGQTIIKEEFLQPLMDKAAEEIKDIFKKKLKESLAIEDNLITQLQTSSVDKIHYTVRVFLRGDESFSEAKAISDKISSLLQHRPLTALAAALTIIKNSIDLSAYINQFTTYLEENLPGGDNNNNVEDLSEEICSKAADNMYLLLQDTGKNAMELVKTGYNLRNEDLTKFVNKNDLVVALTDQKKWKQIRQTIINEELVQPLLNKATKELRNFLKKEIEKCVRNNQSLTEKLQIVQLNQVNYTLNMFMQGDETMNTAKIISDKISGFGKHKAVTALTTTFTIVKNSVDFAAYINKLSSYLEEHLSDSNCDNNVEEVIDEISSKAADKMYELLKDVGRDSVQLAKITNDLKTENLVKLLDKDQIVAVLTDKEKWKQIGQSVIEEELLKPLMDQTVEEIEHSFEDALRTSIEKNEDVVKKLQSTTLNEVNSAVDNFFKDEEAINATKMISEKISSVFKPKTLSTVIKAIATVKNVMDFAVYIDKFLSYLEQNLPGGDSDNKVEHIIPEICKQSAGRMCSLLKDTTKDAIELANIIYELSNEDVTKLLDKDKIVAVLTDENKWKQIGQTIVKEQIIRPLLEDAVGEIKNSLKDNFVESIQSNDNLVRKLQTTPVDQINKTLSEFIHYGETVNKTKNLPETISRLDQYKDIATLTKSLVTITNCIDVAGYSNQFSSYLQEHLPGGDCKNSVEEITANICSNVANHLTSELERKAAEVTKLSKIVYGSKYANLAKILDKDQIIATLTDKDKWKQIAQSVVKEEVLQPLVNYVFEDIKCSFTRTIKKSIRNNSNLLEMLQTVSTDHLVNIVEEFMKYDETVKMINFTTHKILDLLENKEITALPETFADIKNSVDFDNYCNMFASYLEENLPSNSSDNNVEEMIDEICCETTDQVCPLLKNAINLANIGFRLKNEDLTSFLDKNEIVNLLIDQKNWKNISQTIIEEEVFEPILDATVEHIKQDFQDRLSGSFKSNDSVSHKLQSAQIDKLYACVETMVAENEILSIAKDISTILVDLKGKEKVLNILSTGLDTVASSIDVCKYTNDICSYLDEHLSEGDYNNNLQEIVKTISSKVTHQVFSSLKNVLRNHKVMGGVLRKLNIQDLKKFEVSKDALSVSLRRSKVVIVPLLEKSMSGVTDEALKAMLNKSGRKAVGVITPQLLEELAAQTSTLITEENFGNYVEDVVPRLTQKISNKILEFVTNEETDVASVVPALTEAVEDSVCTAISEAINSTNVATSVGDGIPVAQAIEHMLPHLAQEVYNRIWSLTVVGNIEGILNQGGSTRLKHLIQTAMPHLGREVAKQISVIACDEDMKRVLDSIESGKPVDEAVENIVDELTNKIKNWCAIKDLKVLLVKESLRTFIDIFEQYCNQEFTKQIFKFVKEKRIYEALGLQSHPTFDEVTTTIIPYLTPEIINQVSENHYEVNFKENIYEVLGLDSDIPFNKIVDVIVAYATEELSSEIENTLSEVSFNEEIHKLLGVEISSRVKSVIQGFVPVLNVTISKAVLEVSNSCDENCLTDLVDLIFSQLSHEITASMLSFLFTISRKRDHLKMLNLKFGASLADIRRQYRKLALQLHPQQNPEDPDAEEKYRQLLEVYRHLVKTFETITNEFQSAIDKHLKTFTKM